MSIVDFNDTLEVPLDKVMPLPKGVSIEDDSPEARAAVILFCEDLTESAIAQMTQIENITVARGTHGVSDEDEMEFIEGLGS